MLQPPGTIPHDDAPSAYPPVWLWYRVYAVLMALLYVATAVMGILYLAGAGFLPGVSGADQAIFVIYGVVMLAMGVVFAGLYGAAPFLPKKRWAWIYHTVLIGIGMTSCCCMPFCIPLLIYWVKPDVKTMFEQA